MIENKKNSAVTSLVCASLISLTLSANPLPRAFADEQEPAKDELKLNTAEPQPLPPPPPAEEQFDPSIGIAAPPPPNQDPLGFQVTLPLKPGKTFLKFMQDDVKPALDKFATEGFKVRDGQTVVNALRAVDTKVSNKVTKSISLQNLAQLANGLVASQSKAPAGSPDSVAKFDTLDDEIVKVMPNVGFRNALDLSTFIALASGGGVAVRLDPTNMYYNVNYGTGANKDQRVTKNGVSFTKPGDEVTGRSFGAGNGRNANDVSDAAYLGELERFIKGASATDFTNFYKTQMAILTNCDSSGYASLAQNPLAQVVLTDFTAVYTAEQDRHLMEALQKFQFDVALAEVTWVAGFSAGGSQTRVEFMGKLLEKVPDINRDTKQVMNTTHDASLQDWTRMSPIPCHRPGQDPRSPSHPGCNRSGPNETKVDRRILQSSITQLARQDAQLAPFVKAIEDQLVGYQQVTGRQLGREDIFQELTNYLISPVRGATDFRTASKSPPVIRNAAQLSQAFGDFMGQLKLRADDIASRIEKAQPVQLQATVASASAGNVQKIAQGETGDDDRPATTPEMNPQDGDTIADGIIGFFKRLFRGN